MRRRRQPRAKNAFTLVEEGVQLLRTTPLATLACYYIGSAPLVLGVLYFWADMSRSAFAYRRCLESALGLAVLFVWMKCWQTVFVNRLLAQLACSEPPRWPVRRVLSMVMVQLALQPWGFILTPLALLVLIAFPLTYLFFQNVTIIGNGRVPGVRAVAGLSVRFAQDRSMQFSNTISLLSMFGIVVSINIAVAIPAVIYLLQMLVGLKTPFLHPMFLALNTTYAAVVLGLAYLCCDPLLKTVCAVRYFYGESISSGVDLHAALRRLRQQTVRAGLLLLVLGTVLLPHQVFSGEPAPEPYPGHATGTAQLDQAIDKTLQNPEYSWRLPRDIAFIDRDDLGFFTEMMRWLGRQLKKVIDKSGELLHDFFAWLKKLFPEFEPPAINKPDWKWQWQNMIMYAMVGLFALLVLIGLIFLYRAWRRYRGRRRPDHHRPLAVPDIRDEATQADALPADKWLVLARELLARGEVRLAMRAIYLACLAGLADREVIVIAGHKSNLEYQRELWDRTHHRPELTESFAEMLVLFERTWYGRHQATRALAARIETLYERIIGDAERT